MATTTTVAEVKRALLDELQALSIASATEASPTGVQVTYGRPPIDRQRSESVYFGSATRSIADPEQRLVAGRRKRMWSWEIPIMIDTAIIIDSEDAEARAFVIAAAIENFFAAYSQPAEWPTTPVTSGALSVLVADMESDLIENIDGYQGVRLTIVVHLKERLL